MLRVFLNKVNHRYPEIVAVLCVATFMVFVLVPLLNLLTRSWW